MVVHTTLMMVLESLAFILLLYHISERARDTRSCPSTCIKALLVSSLTQFGTSSTESHTTPKLIDALTGKNLKQISAGVRHCAVSDTTLPVRGVSNITAPSSVPNRYSSLKDISCTAIHNRMLLLNYFSKLITSSWKLFQCHTNSVVSFWLILSTGFLVWSLGPCNSHPAPV